MVDLGSFSETVEKLQRDTTELDRQLAAEDAKAKELQLSAFKAARRHEMVEQEIHNLSGQICELEMEAEDLACLQSQENDEHPSQQRVIHSEDQHRACRNARTKRHMHVNMAEKLQVPLSTSSVIDPTVMLCIV